LRKIFAHILGEVTRYIARTKPNDCPAVLSPTTTTTTTAFRECIGSPRSTSAPIVISPRSNSTSTSTTATTTSSSTPSSNGSTSHLADSIGRLPLSQPPKRLSLVHCTDTNGYPVTHLTLSTPSIGLLDSDSLSISSETTELAEDIICSTLFLRVFVPAICHPYAFRITSELPSLFASRVLVQCSKAVQVVANNSDFGDVSQPHFAAFNRFLASHRAPLRSFVSNLLDVSNISAVDEVPPLISPRPGYELVRGGVNQHQHQHQHHQHHQHHNQPNDESPRIFGLLLHDDELSMSDMDDERDERALPSATATSSSTCTTPKSAASRAWLDRDMESSDHLMYDAEPLERKLPPEYTAIPNTAQVLATIWKEYRQQIFDRLPSISNCLQTQRVAASSASIDGLQSEYSADDEASCISRSASLDNNHNVCTSINTNIETERERERETERHDGRAEEQAEAEAEAEAEGTY
jgi:hypothetical protein